MFSPRMHPLRVLTAWVLLTLLASLTACSLLTPPPTAFKPAPSADWEATPTPSIIRNLPDRPKDYFTGPALTYAKRGSDLLAAGEYQAAADNYKEALRHHGKPSYVLEAGLGSAYSLLQMYSLAIDHQSNAIAIRDDALGRVNRGFSYVDNGQCDLAILDAQLALSMEPYGTRGLHTDVKANSVLAFCHEYNGNNPAALEHLDATIRLAIEHGYGAEALSEFQLWHDDLSRAAANRP